MKKLSLLLAAMSFAVHAHATSSADLAPEIYGNGTTGTTPPTATNPGTTQFPKYNPPAPPPPPAVTPTPPKSASINPSANQGQQSQNSGAGANAAAGAALIASGMALMSQPPTVPAGAALIAMGMLALAQSGHDSGAANQSAATGASSVYGNGSTSTAAKDAVANPQLGSGKSAFNSQAVKDAQASLANAGYSVTPSGLTTPDGSTIPNSAFNSAGGMAAAGLGSDQIKAVQDALGKVNSDIGSGAGKISAVAVSEGGGGGSSADKPASEDFSFTDKGSVFGLSDAAKKAMVAGKTVNFDGDPIGVRGNNIFDMIHVAYQKKRDSHDFLDSESGAASPTLRAPASAAPPAKKIVAPARAKINNR